MMKTRIGDDGTLETDYSEESLKRAHDAAQPIVENTGNPGFSKTILKMVKKMREGSIADNNKRSQQIVKAQKKEMKKMDRKKNKAKKDAAKKDVEPIVKHIQRTLVDF